MSPPLELAHGDALNSPAYALVEHRAVGVVPAWLPYSQVRSPTRDQDLNTGAGIDTPCPSRSRPPRPLAAREQEEVSKVPMNDRTRTIVLFVVAAAGAIRSVPCRVVDMGREHRGRRRTGPRSQGSGGCRDGVVTHGPRSRRPRRCRRSPLVPGWRPLRSRRGRCRARPSHRRSRTPPEDQRSAGTGPHSCARCHHSCRAVTRLPDTGRR